MIGRARSWLYVPAHRPQLLVKAMDGPADAVVYDLEDAVPPQLKESARENALAALNQPRPKPLWLRINHPDSSFGQRDVDVFAGCTASGVRVPKSADPTTSAQLAERLGVPLHLLVESALGVENAFALASAHPLIASVSLGEADLLADLRVRHPEALEWARQRVVTANRAAGLPGPPHAVWTAVADTAGLIADTDTARERGFFGRSVVHPAQVEAVNRAFTPTGAEVSEAARVLDSLREYDENGAAAWLDENGRFVDPAVVARSRWVLELARGLAVAGARENTAELGSGPDPEPSQPPESAGEPDSAGERERGRSQT